MEVCEALNVNMLAIQTDLPIQVRGSGSKAKLTSGTEWEIVRGSLVVTGILALASVRSRRVIADLDPHWELVCEGLPIPSPFCATEGVCAVCKQLQCDDVHVFSLDPASGGHVHTRNFNPIHRMEEEAASASSNAAVTGRSDRETVLTDLQLVAYLHVNRVLPIESHVTDIYLGCPLRLNDPQDRVICEQGYSCGLRSKPSKVFVKVNEPLEMLS
eukprot:765838-Hanusia_phi.AAC.5